MEVVNYYDMDVRKVKKFIKEGIVVYPTDTIYGIGCNALDSELVSRIRELKKRDEKPFSVIAPSKKWIFDNFVVYNKNHIKEGPFTFILKMKKKVVCSEVNNGMKTVGVRLPNHPFMKVIQGSNVPFVTTSVNVSGKRPIFEVKEIPRGIRKGIDLVIDAGKIEGSSSVLIDLTSEVPKIVRR